MQLNQKETSLLKDLKDQEQLCIEKYTSYSLAATDQTLKNIFSEIAQTEQRHLDTLTQIGNGAVPTTSSSPQSSHQGSQSQQKISTIQTGAYSGSEKNHDKFLCTDLLTTEKHVSSLYDTCIFEFRDENIRNILNHIQKEEQEHGKKLYDYMNANGMYS